MAAFETCMLLALLLLADVVPVPGAGDAGASSSRAVVVLLINLTNSCNEPIWPAISSSSSSAAPASSSAPAAAAAQPYTTGFGLTPKNWRLVTVPWEEDDSTPGCVVVWGRTLCSTDMLTGRFSCVTGDCGTGREDCAGFISKHPSPPATIAEFTLNVDRRQGMGAGEVFSYAVTAVDGYSNLPILLTSSSSSSDQQGIFTLTFCPRTDGTSNQPVVDGSSTPPAAAGRQQTPPDSDSDSDSDEARIALIVSILSLLTAVLALLTQCASLIKKICCR